MAGTSPEQLVASARKQVGVTVSYDPGYRRIGYPGGDVPMHTGVCTDVIIRALREQGIDLQKEVHLDMRANFSAYPKRWKAREPDPNIDHRRVPNLMVYFQRKAISLKVSRNAGEYAAGDIVTWNLGGGMTHIGIVSDRKTVLGTPLLIHNIGRGAKEEDILFGYEITGHYRVSALLERRRYGNLHTPLAFSRRSTSPTPSSDFG